MPNIVETSDAAANTATAYTLAVGSTATGSVTTSGDHDWYRVNLVAGTTYQINLDGSGTGALSDPYLYLRDSTGAQIASNDDSGTGHNSQFLYFRPTVSGAYYLDAAAYGTLTGQYTLSAVVTTPVPTYTVDQVAAYIQDGMGSHFSINTITYNVNGLTAAEQTLRSPQ